jgi:hypothetical protein
MDRLNHWRYFLSLEKEFAETLRFVEFTPSQQSVYSFEFARLLILICSELDVLFKVVCRSACPGRNPDSIGKYFSCVSGKYRLESEAVRVDRLSTRVLPFEHWGENSPPAWWTAQNKVKHHRHEHFQEATLGNTLHALCGLFVGNLLALNEFSLIDQVHDVPVLLGRDDEPGHLLLESGYRVELRDS